MADILGTDLGASWQQHSQGKKLVALALARSPNPFVARFQCEAAWPLEVVNLRSDETFGEYPTSSFGGISTTEREFLAARSTEEQRSSCPQPLATSRIHASAHEQAQQISQRKRACDLDSVHHEPMLTSPPIAVPFASINTA